MFISNFAMATALHLYQARRYRIRWLLPTAVVCGILEIIGWSGRLWSSSNVYLRTPFLMQVATTIMAPSYLFIANFIIFIKITRRLGPQFLRLSVKWYSILFFGCGTITLVIQAVGGGLASGTEVQLGSHIALGGLCLQLVLLVLYTAFAAEFVIRFNQNRPSQSGVLENGVFLQRGTLDGSIKKMLIGVFVIVALLLIRVIYRIVGISEGWGGTVLSTQWMFVVFDGGLMIMALLTLNRFHPGVLLPGPDVLEADFNKLQMQDHESQALQSYDS